MSTARIPFALVGVLLLVGSATFAGSLGGPTVEEPGVDRAMDRTEAATQSAVRDAVTTAAVEAARNPVTVRASTPTGRVLSRSDTFRDALRVRIYLAVRDRLERISRQRNGVTVTASLPETQTPDDLAAAIDRLSVEPAGSDGTDLRATVQNVTLTARRGDRVVGRRTVSPTVTVPVPTLAVHNRVEQFETRLNAGPAESGLGGRLTAQLYALTWTRGYAQFGGAPITNIVANRHLSLLTNTNVLSMQREHFGTSDPRGRSVLRWAVAHTAIADAIEGSDNRVADFLSELRKHETLNQLPATMLSRQGATDPQTAAEDTVTIAVNGTADRAFFETLDDINETIRETYTATVERRQTIVDRTKRVVSEPRDPESDWELRNVRRSKDFTVTARDAPEPSPDGPWHVFEYYPRRVTLERTIERDWNTSEGIVTTVEIRRTNADVNITLVGRHDGGSAPDRPFGTVHESGGPLDGPNLKEIENKARDRLLGGVSVDYLAVEAIRADGKTTTVTLTGERPDGIYPWVYGDIRDLREKVRDLSVTTTRGKLATFQINPGNRLARKLDARWGKLVDAPPTYPAVPNRARANVRTAFLRNVRSHLQKRARQHEQSREEIGDELDERDLRSMGEMRDDYERRGSERVSSSQGMSMRVETAPSYLTLGKLDGDTVPTLPSGETTHPLVARNWNLVTVPYGDIAEGVVERLLGPGRVRLGTAAQTLKTARTVGGTDTDALRGSVERVNRYLAAYAGNVLRYSTQSDGRDVVAAALGRWETPAERGQAWADGTAAEAIHDEATARLDLSEVRSDRLWLRLKVGTDLVLNSRHGQPRKSPTNRTAQTLKDAGREIAKEQGRELVRRESKRALQKITGKSLSRLPAGLPLAPPLAPWLTTVNYWQVQVRGEYTRFAVSVPRGTPDSPGARLQYVRDDGEVSLDVDGDGSAETLGRTQRVAFRTHTSVAIAVPPGPRGVGDVDGNADERSAGWPAPG